MRYSTVAGKSIGAGIKVRSTIVAIVPQDSNEACTLHSAGREHCFGFQRQERVFRVPIGSHPSCIRPYCRGGAHADHPPLLERLYTGYNPLAGLSNNRAKRFKVVLFSNFSWIFGEVVRQVIVRVCARGVVKVNRAVNCTALVPFNVSQYGVTFITSDTKLVVKELHRPVTGWRGRSPKTHAHSPTLHSDGQVHPNRPTH
jgi:hypothetical protein